jgi:hypothetical protein
LPGLLELLPTTFGMKVLAGYEFETLAERKLFGPAAGEHDVWRLVHNAAGKQNRIPDMTHAGNRSRISGSAVHYGGIKLIATLTVKNRTMPCIEQR